MDIFLLDFDVVPLLLKVDLLEMLEEQLQIPTEEIPTDHKEEQEEEEMMMMMVMIIVHQET